MTSVIEPSLKTRRWRRVEYEQLVELGLFVGERLELLDGLRRYRASAGDGEPDGARPPRRFPSRIFFRTRSRPFTPPRSTILRHRDRAA